MSHRINCTCRACSILDNNKTFHATAQAMRSVHTQVLLSRDNPARVCLWHIAKDWAKLSGEKRNVDELKRLVNKHVQYMSNENPECWPMSSVGARSAHGQISAIESPSPFDTGKRPDGTPLFYATDYFDGFRVTISVT